GLSRSFHVNISCCSGELRHAASRARRAVPLRTLLRRIRRAARRSSPLQVAKQGVYFVLRIVKIRRNANHVVAQADGEMPRSKPLVELPRGFGRFGLEAQDGGLVSGFGGGRQLKPASAEPFGQP